MPCEKYHLQKKWLKTRIKEAVYYHTRHVTASVGGNRLQPTCVMCAESQVGITWR
jgi:hypothetical protein